MTRKFIEDTTNLNQDAFSDVMINDAGPSNHQYATIANEIRYTGAAWEAVAGIGCLDQISNYSFFFNATAKRLEVTISAFDNPFTDDVIPIIGQRTKNVSANEDTYHVKAEEFTNLRFDVQFFDLNVDSQNPIDIEDTRMRFYVILFGRIS